MEIEKILYALAAAVSGFFLKDFYNWVKHKLLKDDTPKVSFSFYYKHQRTQGSNPRLYDFEGTISIENIDKEPIYDLSLPIPSETADEIRFDDIHNPKIIKLKSLPPNKPIKIKLYQRVEYKDSGSFPNEAAQLLPRSFTDPELILSFKSHRKKKFTLEVEKK